MKGELEHTPTYPDILDLQVFGGPHDGFSWRSDFTPPLFISLLNECPPCQPKSFFYRLVDRAGTPCYIPA